MSNLKEKIIILLQSPPDSQAKLFNGLFELYRESENKNVSFEMLLNRSGFTETGLNNLKYDLQKMYDITDAEIHAKKEVAIIPLVTSLPDFVLKFSDAELRDWARTDCVGIGVGLEEVINMAYEESNEFIALVLGDELVQIQKEKAIANISVTPEVDLNTDLKEINTEGGIREEFPFLADKNCPDEFKILVADKLTAFNLYKETKEKISLSTDATAEELAVLGETALTAFDENKRIYDELNHYKTTGTILGKHPIFRKLTLQREVDAMTMEKLLNFKNSSSKYFSTNKADLETATKKNDTAKIDLINNRVAERNEKLALVNKKLGIEK